MLPTLLRLGIISPSLCVPPDARNTPTLALWILAAEPTKLLRYTMSRRAEWHHYQHGNRAKGRVVEVRPKQQRREQELKIMLSRSDKRWGRGLAPHRTRTGPFQDGDFLWLASPAFSPAIPDRRCWQTTVGLVWWEPDRSPATSALGI